MEFSAKDELAAALAAAGTDIEQVVRAANDGFLVLHHQQRVALVAQMMHDANETSHVARVQSHARFVHDEERIHERGPETGRKIHSLHFAAAEGASGTIEREITEPHFAQIG